MEHGNHPNLPNFPQMPNVGGAAVGEWLKITSIITSIIIMNHMILILVMVMVITCRRCIHIRSKWCRHRQFYRDRAYVILSIHIITII